MKKKMNSTKKETKAKKIAAKLDEPDMEIFKTFLKDRKIIEDTQENLDKYKATRREFLKGIVVASGGYAKYEIFTNPEKLAKMRQSCALCSPKSVEIT